MPRIAYECLGVPLRCLWFEQHASAHHGAFGLSRYAFVRFVEVAGATAALKALHGKSFCGSALSVRYKRRLRKKRPVADGFEALPRAPRVEGAGEALPRAPRVEGAGEEEEEDEGEDEGEDEEEDDEEDEDEEAGEAVVMAGVDLEEGGATKATIAAAAASNVRCLVMTTEAAPATELSQRGQAKHGAGYRAEEDEEDHQEVDDSDWEEPVMAGAVAGTSPSRPRQLPPSAVAGASPSRPRQLPPSATPAATWTGELAAAAQPESSFTESSFTESAFTESSFTRSIRSFAAAGMLGSAVVTSRRPNLSLNSATGLHTGLVASFASHRGVREVCEEGADGKLHDLQALARSYNELASSELARWGAG